MNVEKPAGRMEIGRVHRAFDHRVGRVGEIDEHPEPVHLDNHLAAEARETVVERRLRLDVAELVDPVVDQLDRPHAALVRLADVGQPPLAESTPGAGSRAA